MQVYIYITTQFLKTKFIINYVPIFEITYTQMTLVILSCVIFENRRIYRKPVSGDTIERRMNKAEEERDITPCGGAARATHSTCAEISVG
jgi:hypothetical protein